MYNVQDSSLHCSRYFSGSRNDLYNRPQVVINNPKFDISRTFILANLAIVHGIANQVTYICGNMDVRRRLTDGNQNCIALAPSPAQGL